MKDNPFNKLTSNFPYIDIYTNSEEHCKYIEYKVGINVIIANFVCL